MSHTDAQYSFEEIAPTALLALLAGIDGEPVNEDLNSLFRLSQEKQYVDYVSLSLSVIDNFSASD